MHEPDKIEKNKEKQDNIFSFQTLLTWLVHSFME
jgi:hypothetical protein